MSKNDAFLYVLCWLLCFSIIVGVIILRNFYQDYKCSTTTDVKWFTENNCMRFVR